MRTVRFARVAGMAGAVTLCAVILFPFVIMLGAALKTNPEIFCDPADFSVFPADMRWGNFARLAERIPNIWRYFLNSAIIAGGATVLALVVALPAGYALARLRFRGRSLLLNAVLATQMFSPIVIIIGLYKSFAGLKLGWLYSFMETLGLDAAAAGWSATLADNLAGLVLVNAAFNAAFAVWMLSSSFRAIPVDLEHAALVDGCGRWRMMRHVLLPLSGPGIVTAVIFVFIASWNEFIFALTLLATPEKKPVVVGLFGLIGMYEVEWNYVMAGSLLATVPMIGLFLVMERHLAAGLTAGAVKS